MSLPNALIGYTGFVGGNIHRQHNFDFLYNSKNIQEIADKTFGTIVCAAAPGVKWRANKEPDQDWAGIQSLIQQLQTVRAQKCILISTIDVYSQTSDVDENTSIDVDALAPYGKHRRLLEEFVVGNFDALVVRLPGLFGEGLKKNPIFDLLHGSTEFIDPRGVYQFYNLANIWTDIQRALVHNVSVVNLVSEPIGIREVANEVFNTTLNSEPSGAAVAYDVQTQYAAWWGNAPRYAYNRNQVLTDLLAFKNSFPV